MEAQTRVFRRHSELRADIADIEDQIECLKDRHAAMLRRLSEVDAEIEAIERERTVNWEERLRMAEEQAKQDAEKT